MKKKNTEWKREEQCGWLGFKMKYQSGGYENISFFIN